MPITSATYTGLGASSMHAAAASAQTNHTPACHVARADGRRRRLRGRRDRSTGLRRGRHCGLTCPLDNGCAQPGCCVRFPDLGPGTGEVGARPTLTRNCERLCGFCRTPRARLPAVVHRATGAPRRRAVQWAAKTRPSWKGASEDDMSHARRAVACIATLTAALFTFALPVSTAAHAVDPASKATADAAVSWLVAQQQSDGGFELAAVPGLRDP